MSAPEAQPDAHLSPPAPERRLRPSPIATLRRAWEGASGFRGLWLVAVLLPLAGFGGAALLSWRAVDAEARARLARTAEMLHGHALRAFETHEAVLIGLDERVRDMSWDEIRASTTLHSFLLRLDQSTPSTAGLFLVDPNGRLGLASRLPLPPPPVDLTVRDYVQVHYKAGAAVVRSAAEIGTFVSEVTIDHATGAPTFTLSRPRLDQSGRPDGGVVGATFTPEHFAAFYAAVTEDPRNTALLARTDGAVLAMHPPAIRPVGLRLNPGSATARVLQAASAEPAVLRLPGFGADGGERLVAVRRMDDDYPVVVAYGIHPQALQQDWHARLLGPGLSMAAAASLLLWLTARAQHHARRVRLEAERRVELEARLRHSEAGAALGQLAAGVAHDFGNAVQSVVGGVRLLERDAANPEQVRRIASLIASAAERGAVLAGRMLGFARRGAAQPDGTLVPLDPAAALAEVSELLQRTLGAEIRVSFRVLDPAPPAVRVDRAELEAVAVNLAVNARDAMPAGGDVQIILSAETVAAGNAMATSALRPGCYACIVVRDTGQGMDAETLARAGEAFFTSKPEGKGTGLGLSMARGFAARAGGALRIDSAPGRGTEVTLWLPAVPPGIPAGDPGTQGPHRSTPATVACRRPAGDTW